MEKTKEPTVAKLTFARSASPATLDRSPEPAVVSVEADPVTIEEATPIVDEPVTEEVTPDPVVVDAPEAADSPSEEEPLDEAEPTPPTSDPADEVARALAVHRRRRAVAVSLVVLGAAGVLYQMNRPTGPVVTPTRTADAATAPSARGEITAILKLARQWQIDHQSFTGFAPQVPSGVLIGAAGPGMVVSVYMNNTCLYSGVLPSGQKPIYVDTTNSACTQAAINAATQTLASSFVVP